MNWVAVLISVAVALQAVEHLILQYKLHPLDPWETSLSRQKAFVFLQLVRLAAAAFALAQPGLAPTAVMAVATYLTSVRYHGTFNGGSDTMTIHILLALAAAQAFPRFQDEALLYVAGFASLSYFVAGAAKLASPAWRSGEALWRHLLYSNSALPNRFTRSIRHNPRRTRIWAGALIAWEILFPISLLSPVAAGIFLSLGIVFHLLNFYFFGLNRFFWAWLAAYPAVWKAHLLL